MQQPKPEFDSADWILGLSVDRLALCSLGKPIRGRSYVLLESTSTTCRLSSHSASKVVDGNSCLVDGGMDERPEVVDCDSQLDLVDTLCEIFTNRTTVLDQSRNGDDVNSVCESTANKPSLNPEAKEWIQTPVLQRFGNLSNDTTQCNILIRIHESERHLQSQQQIIARLKEDVEEAERKKADWKRQLEERESALRTLRQEKRRRGETIGRLMKQLNDALSASNSNIGLLLWNQDTVFETLP